jgi:hypothetical protein
LVFAGLNAQLNTGEVAVFGGGGKRRADEKYVINLWPGIMRSFMPTDSVNFRALSPT